MQEAELRCRKQSWKAERPKSSDFRHGATGTLLECSCFGPLFPHYTLTPFWNGEICGTVFWKYVTVDYRGEEVLQLIDYLESHKLLGLLT